ncbi:NADH:flavin oxidoreductase [Bacillus sp. Marseille-Q3570]|uniref:NADH:flavin oxidoreductase n=1 Tax=Bacillus sp. Marseille-Q3570 TaxID=2963522 RepID=UPI0021B7D674|nr:NADH:flavin oxidoreductase [Bacillus sp. Marseille-Q3570]
MNPLFNTGKLGKVEMKNRYMVAPMTRVSAEADGQANHRMEKYYERYAKGGFGAIITEGIYLDESYSQGYHNQPGIANEKQMEAWRSIVETVQHHGSKIIAQLMHAGSQAQGNRFTDETVGPSAITPKGEQLPFYGGFGPYEEPKEITLDEIENVKSSFGKAAVYAKDAGFDGIEIHGANGYLLDQFLTDYLNHREDQYGGSLENRLQFMLEIIDVVRQAVGDEFMVGIRISQGKVSDQEYKWPNGEKDAFTIFSQLGETTLDYIHVTDGDGSEPGFGVGTKTLAKAAKEFSRLPVIANGGLGEPEKARKLIDQEQADFISLGTTALANPDAPNRVRKQATLKEFNAKKILMPKAEIKDIELKEEIITG